MEKKFSKIFTILLFLALGSKNVDSQGVMEKYYEQKLDHTGGSGMTWKQRYLENREYFKPGGPVFLTMDGPWFYPPVAAETIQKGSMVQFAKEQGATLILLELRYYGKSRPTSDLSLDNLNKYMTIPNTLADTSSFIKWIRGQPEFKGSKVVGFGQLFAGSRFAQLMKTEPGLLDIGVLSSTPVETRFEYPAFMKNVVELLRKSNPTCTDQVHDAILCLDKIVHGEECGGHNIKDIKQTFNLCTEVDPKNNLDSSALIAELLTVLSVIVAFNNPSAPYNVDKLCMGMSDNSTGLTQVERLAKEVKTMLGTLGRPCLEYKFDAIITRLSSSQWDTPGTANGDRQFEFLRCRYSKFMRLPEGLNLGAGRVESYRNYSLELCSKLYSLSPEQVKAGAEMTNEMYGKRKIPEKCAIFVTEGGDLVQDVEITQQSEAGKCNQVVKSEGGSWNADISEIEANAGKGVKEAKLRLGKLIDTWLKTGDCCTN